MRLDLPIRASDILWSAEAMRGIASGDSSRAIRRLVVLDVVKRSESGYECESPNLTNSLLVKESMIIRLVF